MIQKKYHCLEQFWLRLRDAFSKFLNLGQLPPGITGQTIKEEVNSLLELKLYIINNFHSGPGTHYLCYLDNGDVRFVAVERSKATYWILERVPSDDNITIVKIRFDKNRVLEEG